MQYGNPVPDPVCGRCKKRLEMVVLTEAVYQDGIWLHITCHREGTDQLFRATRLSEVLKEVKGGGDYHLATVSGRRAVWMARR